MHFYIEVFHMFTVSHYNKSQCRGKNVCLFIAIFRMFTIWQKSHEGVNIMLSFIHTNISNIHCFAYISMWG